MAKTVIEVSQADMVRAFKKKTKLPASQFGGFEDGFKLGIQHQAEEIIARNGFDTVPNVEVRVVL